MSRGPDLGPEARRHRLSTVMRYFADLSRREQADDADQSLDLSKRIENVFFTGSDLRWTAQTTLFLADIGTQRLPHLSRLHSIQALHEGTQVLFAGWLWVTGTIEVEGEPTTVCFPAIEAPLEVLVNPGGIGFRARLVGPAEPSPLLNDAPASVVTLLEDIGGSTREPSPEDVANVWAAIAPHIRRIDGRRHTATPATTDPLKLRRRAGLHLVPGGTFHVRSGVRPGSRSHDLLSAAGLDAGGTALDHLYNGATEAPPPAEIPIATGPLNRRQRQAVAGAVSQPVTVVAGPPGTGKTHAAVAAALAAVGAGDSVLIATTSRYAADVIASRFRDVHGLRFLRFGAEDAPAKLFQARGSGPPRAAADVGTALREVRTHLWDSLVHNTGVEQAIEQRTAAAAAGITIRSEVDADRARERLEVALRPRRGVFGRFRARRARRALLAMFDLPETTDDRRLRATVASHIAEADIARAMAGTGISLDDMWAELEEAETAQFLANRHAVAQRSSPRRQSQAVTLLGTALRSGPSQRRRKLQSMAPETITEAIPLWIGTLGEIGSYLPLAPGMFDLIIIDEASHTAQTESAPALLRARRALVLGDPNQLRHVSFVADDRMEGIADQHALPQELRLLTDVRRNSTFDVAAAAAPTVWLDEHHRSTPHIIGFSASRFYDDVRVMTRHPRNESADTIRTVTVNGTFERGRNEAECAAVLELIRDLDSRGSESIGIVTPFRGQADRLESLVLDSFSGEDINRLRLRVGTVHGFQGNQRDVMIISTAVAPDNLSSLRFLQDPNLFNVMVTRARRDIVIVTSVGPDDLPDGVLRDYMDHANEPPDPRFDTSPDRGWTADIHRHLIDYDIRVVAEYPVGPHTIDLVVGTGEAALGVETRVHDNGATPHAERHLALRRAGWTLIDTFESRWLTRPEAAAQHIIETYLRRERSSGSDR